VLPAKKRTLNPRVGPDTARMREIEAQIDRLAAELWGLSEQELEEIQRSLEELG